MYILGIACFGKHTSAVTLVKDGTIVAAVEEGKLKQIKNYDGFPHSALNYCLQKEKITIEEVDYIGFYMKPYWGYVLKFLLFLKYFPKSIKFYIANRNLPQHEKINLPRILKKELGVNKKIYYIEHHLSHAASSFLISPFKESAILTLDGRGEYHTGLLGHGTDNKINVLKKFNLPHSLGLLYSTVTSFLGFKALEEEGSVMGLASYGEPTYYPIFEDIISFSQGGDLRLNTSFFDFSRTGTDLTKREKIISGKFINLLGQPRKRNEKITDRHKDIAASLQKRLEDVVVDILIFLYKKTKSINLCLAGGIFLNCSLNGKLQEKTPFKNIFIQPAASDVGCSLGTAYYIYNTILNNKREFVLKHDYYGPHFSEEDYLKSIRDNKLTYEYIEEIEKKVARLLSQKKIIGWFQDALEFGPRALGNRSILGDPRDEKIRDIINKKVKLREEFRPFAPSVLKEKAAIFFENNLDSPFMLLTSRTRHGRKIIPAVTHINNTARIHTVSKEINGKFWKLIKEFDNITQIPVLLNTSFNIKDNPMVASPQDAIDCFKKTQIDYLVLGNYLIKK